MKAITQYLERYAEPEIQSLKDWPLSQRFSRSLVIPVYDETPVFIDRLKNCPLSQRLLLIAVVNRPDNIDRCPANDELLTYLHESFDSKYQQDCLTLFTNENFGVLAVDRHTTPIPHKQGVGLARKIGCDLAAQLIFNEVVHSHWIHSTDADAQLPDDYFEAERLSESYAAATYGFQHIRNNSDTAKATQLYEQTLYDYVDGLTKAKSPYAFHTIGSIIAVNHLQYCQARGFPKRSGGEDFYLLNKLRKLGNIASLKARVLLEPRVSHRVPFGTGPATARILQALNDQEAITTYNPEIFDQLAMTIDALTAAIEKHEAPSVALSQLPPQSQQALTSLNIEKCFAHLATRNDSSWQLRHLHDWFDAFKTLKFVRFLQANHFPNIPLKH